MFDFKITPMIIAIPVFFSFISLEMTVAWQKRPKTTLNSYLWIFSAIATILVGLAGQLWSKKAWHI